MKEPRLVRWGGRPKKDQSTLDAIMKRTEKGGYEIKGPLTSTEKNRWRKNLEYHTKGPDFSWRFSVRSTEGGGLWITRTPKKTESAQTIQG